MKLVSQFPKLAGFILAVFSSALGTSAHGAERATVTTHFSMLKNSSISKETKAGGVKTESKTDTTATNSLGDSWISLALDKVYIYLYPWSGSKSISAGYQVTDLVEVGIDLGINSSKTDKPKSSTSDQTTGLYAYIYPKLGSLDSEVGLIYDMTTKMTEQTDASTGLKSKSNEQGSVMSLIANVTVPLAKNVKYVGGIFYRMSSIEEKETKVDTTSSEIGVNLAAIRFEL